MIYISPSLLSASLSELSSELDRMYNAKADFAHVDVMDGHFVNNIAFGPSFVASLKKHTKIPLDVHLMISNPYKYIDKFIDAGSDIITIHVETISKEEFVEIEQKVHKNNIKLGITLRPSTDINELLPYLNKVDMILVMSVEPGFSGQKFKEIGLERLEFLSNYRKEHSLKYLLEIDGGIDNSNYQKCIDAGVDILVSGSYLFSSNMEEKIMEMKRNG